MNKKYTKIGKKINALQIFLFLCMIIVFTFKINYAYADNDEYQDKEKWNLRFNNTDQVKTFFDKYFNESYTVREHKDGGYELNIEGMRYGSIVTPREINNSTAIIAVAYTIDAMELYASQEKNNAIAVLMDNKWDEDLPLSGSEIMTRLYKSGDFENFLWFGFSNGGRIILNALSHFLQNCPDAKRQTVLIIDSTTSSPDGSWCMANFSNIDEKFCTADWQLDLYSDNDTKFICLTRIMDFLESEGIEEIIARGNEVIEVRSEYPIHNATRNEEYGVGYRAVIDGIVDWVLGRCEMPMNGYKFLRTSR